MLRQTVCFADDNKNIKHKELENNKKTRKWGTPTTHHNIILIKPKNCVEEKNKEFQGASPPHCSDDDVDVDENEHLLKLNKGVNKGTIDSTI